MPTTLDDRRRIAALEAEIGRLRDELLDARAQAPLLRTLLEDIDLRLKVEAQLRETQEWLQLAQAAGHVAAYTFDYATRTLTWAPSTFTLYGVTADARPSLELWLGLVHPEDRERVAHALGEAETRAAALDHRFRIVRPDGTVRWLQDRGEVRLDASGRPARVVGVNIDVTAEREREADLAWGEARFRALVEATSAVTWTTDAEGMVQEPSRSWSEFTGQDFAAFRGLGWVDAVHPEDQPRAREVWLEAAGRRQFYRVDYRLRRHDGEYRLTHARGVPVLGEDGRVRGWMGANVDITDRVRAERELRDRDERLRAALAGSGAGTFRWDIRTNALDWDVELDRLFGLAAGVTTRSLEGFIASVHPDDRALVVAACERCRDAGADFDETFRVVWPNGTVRWLHDRGRTYSDGDGSPAYMTGSCIDVTERVDAIRRLEASEERLRLAQEVGEIGTYEWRPDTDEVVGSATCYRLWGVGERGLGTSGAFLELIHPDDRDQLYPTGLAEGLPSPEYAEFRIRRPNDGEERWLARRGRLIAADGERPRRVVGAIYDVTEVRRAERQLQAVLESVSDGFLAADAALSVTLLNGAAERHLGLRRETALGRPLEAVLGALMGPDLGAAVQGALLGEGSTVLDVVDGERAFEMRLSPKEGGGVAISFSDATARREAERGRELLVGELGHRVKNTLSIVQSVARMTLRRGGVDPAVQEIFDQRLQALAAAHDMLILGNFDAAYIGELVEAALKAFRHLGAERIVRSGPKVRLPAQTAMSFVLALHELATNAVKYGALSNEEGVVTLDWRVARGAVAPLLKVRWSERGGPPVRPPARTGFGSRLIRAALAGETGGEVELTYEPSGVVCRISAALPYIEGAPEGADAGPDAAAAPAS